MNLAKAEFEILRQTIATRGTVRIVMGFVACAGWAITSAGLFVWNGSAVTSVFSLAVLVGGFETIHALHVGVERIGRYLQVYFPGEETDAWWEAAAMTVGPALPGGGVDPLFSGVFLATTITNLIAAAIVGGRPMLLGVLILLHGCFVLRVLRARRAATRQRTIELESFRAVRVHSHPSPDHTSRD